jgi:hypothetical protein
LVPSVCQISWLDFSWLSSVPPRGWISWMRSFAVFLSPLGWPDIMSFYMVTPEGRISELKFSWLPLVLPCNWWVSA